MGTYYITYRYILSGAEYTTWTSDIDRLIEILREIRDDYEAELVEIYTSEI